MDFVQELLLARREVDANTVWPIASITKVLTAIATMQLVEAKKLSLDQEVDTYLKDVSVPDKFDKLFNPNPGKP